jgi:hypothetical protein
MNHIASRNSTAGTRSCTSVGHWVDTQTVKNTTRYHLVVVALSGDGRFLPFVPIFALPYAAPCKDSRSKIRDKFFNKALRFIAYTLATSNSTQEIYISKLYTCIHTFLVLSCRTVTTDFFLIFYFEIF